MREFVNDCDRGATRDHRRQIEFGENRFFVIDFFERDLLQIADELRGFLASVRFDHADHHVNALFFERVRVFEHLISFSHSGSRADVNAQFCARAFVYHGEQTFGRWFLPASVRHFGNVRVNKHFLDEQRAMSGKQRKQF